MASNEQTVTFTIDVTDRVALIDPFTLASAVTDIRPGRRRQAGINDADIAEAAWHLSAINNIIGISSSKKEK